MGGLERAFFGIPYLDSDGRLSFDEPVEDLDISEGRAFALPGMDDDNEPPRHSFDLSSMTGTEIPPAIDLKWLDSDSQLDPVSLFADASSPVTGLVRDDAAEDWLCQCQVAPLLSSDPAPPGAVGCREFSFDLAPP